MLIGVPCGMQKYDPMIRPDAEAWAALADHEHLSKELEHYSNKIKVVVAG